VSVTISKEYLQFSRFWDSAYALAWCYIRTMTKSANKTAEDVYQAALKLNEEERELLLLKLTATASNDEFTAPEARAAWAEECDRRYQDWQEGKVKAVPGDLVIQRLRERLAK